MSLTTSIIIILLFLSTSISAFGVGSPYFEKNPLVIKPGETKETYINLQNKVGGEEVIARVEVEIGKEIVRINNQQEKYTIPLGEEININLTVSIPKNYKEGNYNLSLIIRTESKNEGQLSLSQGINIKIPLEIKSISEKKKGLGLLNILLICILIILLIIIYVIVRKRKKSAVF